jgi:hypothetical protein
MIVQPSLNFGSRHKTVFFVFDRPFGFALVFDSVTLRLLARRYTPKGTGSASFLPYKHLNRNTECPSKTTQRRKMRIGDLATLQSVDLI